MLRDAASTAWVIPCRAEQKAPSVQWSFIQLSTAAGKQYQMTSSTASVTPTARCGETLRLPVGAAAFSVIGASELEVDERRRGGWREQKQRHHRGREADEMHHRRQ